MKFERTGDLTITLTTAEVERLYADLKMVANLAEDGMEDNGTYPEDSDLYNKIGEVRGFAEMLDMFKPRTATFKEN